MFPGVGGRFQVVVDREEDEGGRNDVNKGHDHGEEESPAVNLGGKMMVEAYI